MHVTLTMIEKMDNLLDEADEYIKCAHSSADDNDLKSAYLDLARCHFEGYEKLSKCIERAVERKAQTMPNGEAIKEMAGWHKDKFDKRAHEIKARIDKAR